MIRDIPQSAIGPALLSVAGLCLLAAVALTAPPPLHPASPQQASPGGDVDPRHRIDSIFAPWDRDTSPGCAVGVSHGGTVRFVGGYGMADLEQGTRITPTTIFEAGSVSKQFVAGAVALLSLRGVLTLDDDIRRWVPEVPDLGATITLRHLLTHTSGLRSQFVLLGLSGRPSGRVVHTVDEMVDLVTRMKELNFPPGDHYLYNNTAFTLLGVVVARATDSSLQEFTGEEFFEPLAMGRTQWRDDHTRIVPGRATAYAGSWEEGFREQMPFTDVYGSGALLTTVEDLLRWSENTVHHTVGGEEWTRLMETPGRLNDGAELSYALGLGVGEDRGLREVSHGGSTAGYRAYLLRYPDEHLSVALLCNAASIVTEPLARGVAAVFLGGRHTEPAPLRPVAIAPAQLDAMEGTFRHEDSGELVDVVGTEGGLRMGNTLLVPIGGEEFRALASGTVLRFTDGTDRFEVEGRGAGTDVYVRIGAWAPGNADLDAFAGVFHSPELAVRHEIEGDENGGLVLHIPLLEPLPLVPAHADAFRAPGGRVLEFSRGANGRPDGFRLYAGRVWHLRFERVSTP